MGYGATRGLGRRALIRSYNRGRSIGLHERIRSALAGIYGPEEGTPGYVSLVRRETDAVAAALVDAAIARAAAGTPIWTAADEDDPDPIFGTVDLPEPDVGIVLAEWWSPGEPRRVRVVRVGPEALPLYEGEYDEAAWCLARAWAAYAAAVMAKFAARRGADALSDFASHVAHVLESIPPRWAIASAGPEPEAPPPQLRAVAALCLAPRPGPLAALAA